uniref:Uncharacterized protein n=1 Tax=Rhizophora mucronata TaxID=61149 RepID=A0A2P2NBT9_RHIMU
MLVGLSDEPSMKLWSLQPVLRISMCYFVCHHQTALTALV